MSDTLASDAPIVTIIGGSGFVGRYIARAMAKRGWRVRAACRRPNEAGFLRTYGVVGQVEPVLANVRDKPSLERAVEAADAVVYSVGVLFNAGKNTFQTTQADGPRLAAEAAKAAGVKRFVLISAIADVATGAEYARTKAEGEAAVLEHYPDAVILRPSIVFGPEDAFFNRFAGMARFSPAIPVVSGKTEFQPVYVDDVAEAAALALEGKAAPGVYELGGPNTYSFRDLVKLTLDTIRRKRLIVDLPVPIARLQGKVLQLLPEPPITEDQVKLLARDNVVSPDAKTLVDLGITPEAPEGIIEGYLVRFRPRGQYEDMIEAARSRQS
ncbi:MAG: complex I NDUFA9 subunit family protein [Pseudomonadota bacterium]